MDWLIRKNCSDEYGILKLQNTILNIMQDIDKLCKNNNIQYYIIGGTALGAVRHGGFIPWDDDLDIAMTRENYNKFCKVFRSQADKNKYFFQESQVDWSGYYSKVRLLGTYMEELEYERNIPKGKRGIFIDIFPLDNAPNNKISQFTWYICGKMLVAHGLLRRGYSSASFIKKCYMALTYPLYIKPIHDILYNYVLRFNNKKTNYIGGFTLISNFKNSITPAYIWGKPQYVNFETIQLQASSENDRFLKFYFGDYMQMPPIEARRSKHMINVNLGNY